MGWAGASDASHVTASSALLACAWHLPRCPRRARLRPPALCGCRRRALLPSCRAAPHLCVAPGTAGDPLLGAGAGASSGGGGGRRGDGGSSAPARTSSLPSVSVNWRRAWKAIFKVWRCQGGCSGGGAHGGGGARVALSRGAARAMVPVVVVVVVVEAVHGLDRAPCTSLACIPLGMLVCGRSKPRLLAAGRGPWTVAFMPSSPLPLPIRVSSCVLAPCC